MTTIRRLYFQSEYRALQILVESGVWQYILRLMAFPAVVLVLETLISLCFFNFENKAPGFISKCVGVLFKVSRGSIESAPGFI